MNKIICEDNWSTDGGCMNMGTHSNVSITESIFKNNSATFNGGGIYILNSLISMYMDKN